MMSSECLTINLELVQNYALPSGRFSTFAWCTTFLVCSICAKYDLLQHFLDISLPLITSLATCLNVPVPYEIRSSISATQWQAAAKRFQKILRAGPAISG